MIENAEAQVLLTRADLLTNAQVIEARAGDQEGELTRLLRVRRFIAASLELTRCLHAQTECALVNHCGTMGTRSLEEATELLYRALAEYARQCRALAIACRKSAAAPEAAVWEGNRLAVAGV